MYHLRFAILIVLTACIAPLHALSELRMFGFYGRNVSVHIESGLKAFAFPQNQLNYITVATALNSMDKMGLPATVAELKQSALTFSLDNLGYFQLLKVFSVQCFPNQSNSFRKAIVWYGLRQAGIDAIVAGYQEYFNLFVRMENSLDGGYYITHKGQKYVSASLDKMAYDRLEVFQLQLLQDSAKTALQLDVFNTPQLGNNFKDKTRTFSYGTNTYTLNTRYNMDVVNYLTDLPSFRIGSYLYSLAPTAQADKSMDDSLKIWLKGKTYSEKLNFILALVQGAFPYKADREYRPGEKRNFVEQTLADDYVDCEDKAALFCYLANKYLSVETVMLYSKSATHVCCAIELPANAPGFTFKHFGKPYLVCEPAFQGFKPGETELTQDEIIHLEVFN